MQVENVIGPGKRGVRALTQPVPAPALLQEYVADDGGPSTHFLWVGGQQQYLLSRDEVRQLREHLAVWLETGRLGGGT